LNQEASFRPSSLRGFAGSELPRPVRGGGGGASGNTGLLKLTVNRRRSQNLDKASNYLCNPFGVEAEDGDQYMVEKRTITGLDMLV
jgi:hypothetical protein